MGDWVGHVAEGEFAVEEGELEERETGVRAGVGARVSKCRS